MNDIVYNSIGTNYNSNRAADIRILSTIEKLLVLQIASTIADIGAGTGNYSNAFADLGYKVRAVEPSSKMRSQTTPINNVTWFSGTAESIPLSDNSVNGIIVILALHHFSSLESAASEMHRICPTGPIVIFTLDPREGREPWFKDYFPEIYQNDFVSFPPIDHVVKILANSSNLSTTIEKFPLPIVYRARKIRRQLKKLGN